MHVHIVQPLNPQNLARHIEFERICAQDIGPLQAVLDRPGAVDAQLVVFRTVDAQGGWRWFELRAQLLTRIFHGI